MKKNRLQKVLSLLFAFSTMGVVAYMFLKQTCSDRYSQIMCSMGNGGQEAFVECCPEYSTVWTKLTSGEIFFTLLTLAVLYAVFFYLFTKLFDIFNSDFKGRSIYQRIYIIEWTLILLAVFLYFSLFVGIYDGTSCILDNCADMSFLLFFSFWGVFIGFVLISPISIMILALPYILAFGYTKVFLKGNRHNQPKKP